MLNYSNRIIAVICTAFVEEMRRKFLTKTARTQGQSVLFFQDPFKLVPVSNVADIADKFTRNEILSSNEIRGIIGFKPSKDPKADELRNKNINQSSAEIDPASSGEDPTDPMSLG
jgi:predicted component of type VI protein secretion system